jgi:SagB-type dehydrogenase family enzyme
MKAVLSVFIFLFTLTTMYAQEISTVKLNAPDKARGSAIMKALSDRHSERNFSEKKLSLQDLSDLLWAATGINRPESGMRTAATAMNKQDIDVYVILQEGAYLYDVKAHELKPVAAGDHRPLIADQQQTIAKAPVCLLIVSDLSRFGNLDEETKKQWAAVDAGNVSQNIALFSAGCGLVTVPRAFMNKEALREVLKLTPTQVPIINNPVGYPQNKNVVTFSFGKFQVSTLSEKMQKGNPGILVGATQDALQKYLPDGTFPMEVNAFLVRTPDKTILIDAGLGQNLSPNLNSLDIPAEQIDVILMTHLHGDHIGGLLRDGKPAFPNADMYLSKAEYDYWIKSDNKQAVNVLSAYKDKLKLFVPEELGSKKANLFPGFQGIAAYGHTPGHTAYLIESEASKLLIWGDIAHVMAIQMPVPQVAVTYDSDAQQAIKYRKKILDYVSKNKISVGGMHIIFPAIGNVKAIQGGYEFTPF